MAAIIIISFIIIASIQLNRIGKKKLWKEMAIYSILMIIGLVYSLGLVYEWKLPTVSKITTIIFKPVANVINQDSEE